MKQHNTQTLVRKFVVSAILSGIALQALAQQTGPICVLSNPDPALPGYLEPSDQDWAGGRLPKGWKFAIGPRMMEIVNSYTGVADAILDAAAQWSSAVPGRGFGWNGVNAASASDCPSGLPFQIGALNFGATTGCDSLNALKSSVYYQPDKIIAYADHQTSGSCPYPKCGTKSVVINLQRAWTTSLTPLPGAFDLQAAMVHELGHSLGLAHMDWKLAYMDPNGSCITNVSKDCDGLEDSTTPSMQNEVRAGQICQRTILGGPLMPNVGDYSSIRRYYPND